MGCRDGTFSTRAPSRRLLRVCSGKRNFRERRHHRLSLCSCLVLLKLLCPESFLVVAPELCSPKVEHYPFPQCFVPPPPPSPLPFTLDCACTWLVVVYSCVLAAWAALLKPRVVRIQSWSFRAGCAHFASKSRCFLALFPPGSFPFRYL